MRMMWQTNGSHLTAWVNDDEMFDIRVREVDWGWPKDFELRINSMRHIQSVFLGGFPTIGEAQEAAQRHIGVKDSTGG